MGKHADIAKEKVVYKCAAITQYASKNVNFFHCMNGVRVTAFLYVNFTF
jgi:hypothetical protein